MRSIVSAALLFSLIPAGGYAQCFVHHQGATWVIGNSQVAREFQADNTWHTTALLRERDKTKLAVNGIALQVTVYGQDQPLAGPFTIIPGSITSHVTSRRAELSVRLQHEHPHLVADLRYWVAAGDAFLRKQITLADAPNLIIDQLVVESLGVKLPCTRGGMGQPVFIDDEWFAGLEYPGGQEKADGGQVVLCHWPGRPAVNLVSKTAVLGTRLPGRNLAQSFAAYIDTIAVPPRNFLQYNSWYDLRRADLTPANLLKTFAGFRQHLLQPYGLTMQAVVPDDGWQNKESIWQPDAKRFPHGFAPLAQALAAQGTRLGLWMPLNGTNLDIKWGVAHGYEEAVPNGGHYCLSAPKYNQAIHAATARLIKDGHLAYYKHDFNSFPCLATDHGHLPTERHSFEANLDAELKLLAYERQQGPGIFLNLTSGMWLSPWWLMHANSIWMGCGDFGYDRTYPQLSRREWAMSYRDGYLYGVYRQDKSLFPLSRLMTHGIIEGRLNRLGGRDETLREWSDAVVMYYGRGVLLKELYITPDLLDQPKWQVLGHATKWAVDNSEVLRHTVMVGGDPRLGETYGYAHSAGDRAIWVLRNPAPAAQSITVDLGRATDFFSRQPGPYEVRCLYPYQAVLANDWRPGEHKMEVPGVSVMVLDIRPAAGRARPPASAPLSAIAPATVATTKKADGSLTVTATFSLPREKMPLCNLYLIARSPSGAVSLPRATIDGQAVRPRHSSGPRWVLDSYDLRKMGGGTVKLEFTLPAGGHQPFGSTKLSLQGWLIADRPIVNAPPLNGDKSLPWPIAQTARRQTTRLFSLPELSSAAPHSLTAADLAHLMGAVLRLDVFDVNSQAQWRGKQVLLNGLNLGELPANQGPLSAWQTKTIKLTAQQLQAVAARNTIVITNPPGDCFKVRGLALSVQRPDGRWVDSPADTGVYSSVPDWKYDEGTVFSKGRSPEIVLRLPVVR